jgi:hypothetical protein
VLAFIHREEVFKKKEDKIPFEGKAELIIITRRIILNKMSGKGCICYIFTLIFRRNIENQK